MYIDFKDILISLLAATILTFWIMGMAIAWRIFFRVMREMNKKK